MYFRHNLLTSMNHFKKQAMGLTGFGPKFPVYFSKVLFQERIGGLDFLMQILMQIDDVRRVGVLTERKLGAISDPVLLTRMCSPCMLGILRLLIWNHLHVLAMTCSDASTPVVGASCGAV